MATKIFDSICIDYTVAGSACKAGDVVSFNSGALVGVAQVSGEIGEKVSVALSGRYSFPCSSLTCTAGAPAYWDATNTVAVATVPAGSTYPQVGIFAESLTSVTGTVAVILGVSAITKTTSAG